MGPEIRVYFSYWGPMSRSDRTSVLYPTAQWQGSLARVEKECRGWDQTPRENLSHQGLKILRSVLTLKQPLSAGMPVFFDFHGILGYWILEVLAMVHRGKNKVHDRHDPGWMRWIFCKYQSVRFPCARNIDKYFYTINPVRVKQVGP